MILESVRGTLYKNCGRAIRSYLDSQNLSYSEFTVCEKLTEDRIPVKFADKLLHDSSCSAIDQCIGNTAVYYGIMDYRHESKNGCEGCYYAIAKISSAQSSLSEYHIISQTFSHDASGENERSHFAIRKSTSSHRMVTLDKEYSHPVLAAFGCVDMIGLLINITGITTKQQAAELANAAFI